MALSIGTGPMTPPPTGPKVAGSRNKLDFYRIRVSEEASAGGIAIRAWTGVKGDRIKLLLFDSHGELRWQADGLPQKIMGVKGPLEGVVATMPFAENEMLVLGKPAPDIMLEVSPPLSHHPSVRPLVSSLALPCLTVGPCHRIAMVPPD